jgi:transcription antitermination factor NusG
MASTEQGNDTSRGRNRTPNRPIRQRSGRRGRRSIARERLDTWVVVTTKSGQENYAKKNIERQGLRTMLPLRHVPGKKWKLQPMFPRYLFVKVEGAYSFLHNTFGVAGVIMQGGEVAKVPFRVIRDIRRMMNEDGIVILDNERPLVKGEAVEIVSGSFQNLVAVYDGDEFGAVRLLFEFMGIQTSMNIERHKVRPLEP